LKRILLVVIALILYGSFYPWQFHAIVLPGNPLSILLHSWPESMDRFFYRDAAVNVTLYAPFGVFCFLSMSESRSRALRGAATLAAAILLSSSIEMTQLFDAGRVCSLFDVVCNTAGAAAGVAIAATFPGAISAAVSEVEATGAFRLSGVVALLYLFVGYQLFPFFPAFSQHALRAKLAVLAGSGAWSLRDLFESLSGWLALSALVETLVGRKRFAPIVALTLLLIPLKLLISSRTMTASELAGALSGVACWMMLRRLRRPQAKLAALLALAALILAGLIPFRFAGQPQAITWVPFLAMLQMPWESAFVILLGKSFLYGSAVWLLHQSGRAWLTSSALVALPLAGVEAMQVYLPGRTPETTDPLLAILLGCGLMLLERPGAGTAPPNAATAPSRSRL
jgi:VanZ family protein